MTIDPATVGMGVAFVLMSLGYTKEHLEKKRFFNGTPPDWATRLMETQVLFAEQIEGVNAEKTADYLGVEREPSLEDIVEAD